MILGFIDVPPTAAFALALVLLSALLAHRLAIARDKKKLIPLSGEEKAVLIAASSTGKILLMRVDLYGEWVRAGDTDFIQANEPAFAARYLEALYRLTGRGLVMAENDGFRLSGSGFSIALKLVKK